MNFKNILITGGCGFLGQYLINDLLEQFPDAHIYIIDLRPNPNALFDQGTNDRVTIHLGKDILDYTSIESRFQNIDLVIHLAGLVSFSIKDEQKLNQVNVEGTKNVLKAIRQYNINNLVHISSVAALGYNDDPENPVNEQFSFDWKIAQKRKKFYMLTKHLADIEVQRSADQGLNALILYPGLMLGPGDVTNSAKLINAINKRKIPFNMPGGTNVIDVRDVANATVQALKYQITKGHFLLSGYNLTFKQINSTIANCLSVKPPKFTLPRCLNPLLFRLLLIAESKASKKLELTADNLDSAFKFRYFDNSKAKSSFDWQQQLSFEQTINDTIEWMNQNGLFE